MMAPSCLASSWHPVLVSWCTGAVSDGYPDARGLLLCGSFLSRLVLVSSGIVCKDSLCVGLEMARLDWRRLGTRREVADWLGVDGAERWDPASGSCLDGRWAECGVLFVAFYSRAFLISEALCVGLQGVMGWGSSAC